MSFPRGGGPAKRSNAATPLAVFGSNVEAAGHPVSIASPSAFSVSLSSAIIWPAAFALGNLGSAVALWVS